MAEKKKKPTWTDVKKALGDMRREELINTIGDLYNLRKENKQFLHIRYHLEETPLDIYKQKILDSILPTGNRKISFKNARQALSDYKKASGDPDGVAELMIHYCICCFVSIENYGVWEQFADATINIWYDTLTFIQKLPPEKYKSLWHKMKILHNKLPDTGWGVTDMINDYLFEFSPCEEFEDTKPTKLEDMW